jgi:hypothetical protein
MRPSALTTILCALLVSQLAACSCGDNNTMGGDDAGPDDTTAPTSEADPPGGLYRATVSVTITADEPATIYYTVDGTEPDMTSDSGASPLTIDVTDSTDLAFFAVDDAGNAESPQTESYVIDRLGPQPVTNFAASVTDDDIDLSWANPTAPGLVEVVVARVPDVLAAQPQSGDSYSVGDSLGGGTVIFVGSGTSVSDLDLAAGNYTYAAWARYDTGEYSDPRSAAARIAIAPMVLTMTVDVGAQTVTFSDQPPGYSVAGDNVVFAGGSVTFDVTLTSTQAGITFNPKLALSNLSAGTWSDPEMVAGTNTPMTIAGGSLDGQSFRYYGPEGMAESASATRSFEFTGVSPTATITAEFAVQDDYGVILYTWGNGNANGFSLVDLGVATGGWFAAAPIAAAFSSANRDPQPGYRGGFLTADGRYLFVGSRNAPRADKIDLTTMTAVAGLDVDLDNTNGAVTDLVAGTDGTRLYLLVNDGNHTGARRQSTDPTWADTMDRPVEGTKIHILEVDPVTMTELRRLTVTEVDETIRGRRIAISPDGRTLAVSVGNQRLDEPPVSEIFVVDIASWTVDDTDGGAAGNQGYDPSGLRPSALEFSADGTQLVFNDSRYNESNDPCDHVGVLTLASGTVATYDLDDNNVCQRRAISFSPSADGTMWIGLFGDPALNMAVLDLGTGDVTGMGSDAIEGRGIGIGRDGDLYMISDRRVYRINRTTGEVEQQWNNPNSHYLHEILMTP